jgi:tetratricopeptide (TPR) repeat protein
MLTDCPAVEFRNPERALQLANRCVQLAPLASTYWSTMGMARYRAGQWKEAVEAFEKTIELDGDGDAIVLLFISMAQWQLGEKEEACGYLYEAQESFSKTLHPSEDIRRYQQEAEMLFVTTSVN